MHEATRKDVVSDETVSRPLTSKVVKEIEKINEIVWNDRPVKWETF